MNGKAIVPLVVGLGIGLLAIKLVFDYVGKAQGAGSDLDVISAVTCTQDIPLGMQISREMITTTDIPKVIAPTAYIPGDQLDKVVGRVVGVMMSRGYPLVNTALAPIGTPPGLVVKIPPGYRAIAVKVAEEQQAGGWLVPGTHVDVSVVLQAKNSRSNRSRTISKVILENVEVAAVGQLLGSETKELGANVVKSVTLLVKAEDVPKLHYAQTKGKVTFAVRSQQDTKRDELALFDEDEFLNRKKKQDDNEQEQSSKSKSSSSSAISSLMGVLMAKALSAKANAVREELPELPEPFTVEIMNGEESQEKTYVSQWSSEEIKQESEPFSITGKRQSSRKNLFQNIHRGSDASSRKVPR